MTHLSNKPDLVYLAAHMIRSIGVNVYGQILTGDFESNCRIAQEIEQEQREWLFNNKLRGFYNVVISKDYNHGLQSLLQLAGVGKLKPNILYMGFPEMWRESSDDVIGDYLNTIHWAFDLNLGVCMLRIQNREKSFGRKDSHYLYKFVRYVACKQTGKQTHKQTGKQTGKYTHKQTNP